MKFDKLCDLLILPEGFKTTGEAAIIPTDSALEAFLQYNQTANILSSVGKYPANSKAAPVPIPEEVMITFFGKLKEEFPTSLGEITVLNAEQFSYSRILDMMAKALQTYKGWGREWGPAKSQYIAKNLLSKVINNTSANVFQIKKFKGDKKISDIEADIEARPVKQRGRPSKPKTHKILQKNIISPKQQAIFADRIISFISDGSANLKELQTAIVRRSVIEDMYNGDSIKAADDFQSTLEGLVASGEITKVITRGSAPEYKLGDGSSDIDSDSYSPDKLDSALDDADWMGAGSGEEDFDEDDLEPKENPRIAMMKKLMNKYKK